MQPTTARRLLAGFAALSLGGLLLADPIGQDPNYHHFADARGLFGIANFGDVMSNAPFVFVGLAGLWRVRTRVGCEARFMLPVERMMAALAFAGILLVGPGSAYYHLSPDNDTLLWDRLPMTIGFMAIFAMMILERVSVRLAPPLLPLLLALGVFSVFYWHHTETEGAGDLRLYAWVQFFPTLSIPLMLLWFPPRYSHQRHLWRMIGWYALAKVLEHFDAAVFSLTAQAVSGHSLKHLAASVGCWELVCYIKNRRRV